MTVDVPSIKVTVTIEGSKLPRDILPPEGTPGSAKGLVSLQVKAGEVELSASLKAKNYRDVLSRVDAAPHGLMRYCRASWPRAAFLRRLVFPCSRSFLRSSAANGNLAVWEEVGAYFCTGGFSRVWLPG